MKKVDASIGEICIIDDDPIFVFIITRQIRTLGFTGKITVYENGKEALDVFTNYSIGITLPQYILLDVFMPIMDAWDFLKHFKNFKNFSETVIHLVTVSLQPYVYKKAKQIPGIAGILTKPVVPESLNSILKHVLSGL